LPHHPGQVEASTTIVQRLRRTMVSPCHHRLWYLVHRRRKIARHDNNGARLWQLATTTTRRTLAYVLPRGRVVIDCSPHSSNAATAAAIIIADDSSSPTAIIAAAAAGSVRCRLPAIPREWIEFPDNNSQHGYFFFSFRHSIRTLALSRTLQMALHRVVEPPTLHLLAAASLATLGIGAVEATFMCQQWPFFESFDAGRFVCHYTVQNLFPSVVWETHDAKLVVTSLGLDPYSLLSSLTGDTVESATLLLRTQWLGTSRYFFAGFMMIAQLVRAASISMDCFTDYQQRIVNGREPPLSIHNGLIVRLCGSESHLSEVSLRNMGVHLFPVFEHPDRVRFLVRQYSHGKQRPVYWCCRPGLYWRSYSWDRFPADQKCFITTADHNDADDDPAADRILVLEADATNGNDPLSIGNTALGLTLEDASEGFRRILQRYRQRGLEAGRDFRTLRVYLGNSMEVTQTGGGHSYTIRHRVRYAKEMDVLIDSRAPVLSKILEWCNSVTAGKQVGEKKIFFQTSSREYFLNLKSLLKQYGYDIYDPLDLRMLHTLRETLKQEDAQYVVSNNNNNNNSSSSALSSSSSSSSPPRSFLAVLLDDPKYLAEELDEHGAFLSNSFFATTPTTAVIKDQQREFASASRTTTSTTTTANAKDMLRMVVRLAKLPRLVHMETTAKTVNAVEALVTVGEVDASRCCALLDRHEGVVVLEETLRHRSEFVQSQKYQWQRKQPSTSQTSAQNAPNEVPTDINDGEVTDLSNTALPLAVPPKQPWSGVGGLQFICSSSIHDDILRQVRYWARQGYSAAAIQNEIDTRYQEILLKSHTVQKQVVLMATEDIQPTSTKPHNESAPIVERNNGSKDLPAETQQKNVPR
jgi:hypothetical protein